MVKCEVIKQFTLSKYNELKNVERKNIVKEGELFVGDTFECTKEIAEYLTGNNIKKETVVKIIEVIPEEVKEEKSAKKETKSGKKVAKITKKTSKK